MKINYEINNELLNLIEKQLGRAPDNLIGIARYCPFGFPVVLVVKPYSKKGIVFPTTYWLSCPYLVKEVSRLEDRGLIQFYNNKIKTDPEFKLSMKSAHKNYAENRLSYLSKDEKKHIKDKSRNILQVLKKSGVGGIMEKDGIKCLHTHLAHYLAGGGNPVGEEVFARIEWPSDCSCSKYFK